MTLNYSDVKVDLRLPVAIDFSQDQEEPSMINYDSEIFPSSNKVALGSYLSKSALKQIVADDQTTMRFVAKTNLLEYAIGKDLDLIKAIFFQGKFFYAALAFCQEVIPKLAEHFEKFTPRIQRTFELAICESFSKRKITKELLKRINDIYGYSRTIKLFEIATARQQLVDWNFIIKKSKDPVKQLYQQIIANLERVPLPCAAELKADFQELFLERKELVEFASKHIKDIDFLAQVFIYVFARKYLKFKKPWDDPFLSKLFHKTKLKYAYWTHFNLRRKLKEYGWEDVQ